MARNFSAINNEKKNAKITLEAVVGAIDVLRNQSDSATLTAHRLIKTSPRKTLSQSLE